MRLVTHYCLFITVALTLGHSHFVNGEASADPFEQAQTEFLPVKEAFKLLPSVEADKISLYWNIADNYYLYKNKFNVSAAIDGLAINVAPIITGDMQLKYDDYFEEELEVFYHNATLSFANSLTAGLLTLSVESQGCADAGLCYPPQTEHFTIDLDSKLITPGLPKNSVAGKSQTNANNVNDQATTGTTSSMDTDVSLMTAIIFALIGGAILNLMPCVFPVLSMKALSFAAASDNHQKQKLHAAFYTIGVVFSFVSIAALLLLLKAGGSAIGWGFQLQSPSVISFLVYLFFAMGLSLSGVINFGTQLMGVGDSLTSQQGIRGSFFTGVLATVVASPCTAPFMGSALGFALTQPAYVALLVFAALGLGMALPFVALAVFPAVSRFIPKPGPWMETFKQLMAYPMYVSAAWLLWVLGRQSGSDGMTAVILGCIALALAMWLWERRTTSKRFNLIGDVTALAAISFSTTILFSDYIATKSDRLVDDSTPWEAYSPQHLAKYRAQGRAVFIDLTADWCITCLVNEKTALDTSDVLAKMRAKNVVYMKGDWTNYDPDITQLLEQYGRSGVPLYLLFPASANGQATILPQILTKEIVLSALNAI